MFLLVVIFSCLIKALFSFLDVVMLFDDTLPDDGHDEALIKESDKRDVRFNCVGTRWPRNKANSVSFHSLCTNDGVKRLACTNVLCDSVPCKRVVLPPNNTPAKGT